MESGLKVVGPLIAVLPVMFGVYQYLENRKAQQESEAKTEYIQATQLLSDRDPGRQLAGIAAVSQLAGANPERTWLMTESLSAFIRNNAPDSELGGDEGMPSPRLVDPPCRQTKFAEDLFNYAKCNAKEARKHPSESIQAALTAIGTRNLDNENSTNVPVRFRRQFESANGNRTTDPLTPRETVVLYIDENWYAKNRKESHEQLINENQHPITLVYRNSILQRPWLNVTRASLAGADLETAFLEGGNFTQADMSFSRLMASRFARATMRFARIAGSKAYGADFRGANMEFIDARGSDLGHADLREAWMSGGAFARSDFWQAHLSGAYLIASDMSDLQTMSGADMDDIVGYRANFSDARVPGDGIYRVCMRRAYLKEAIFTRADLRGVDLRLSQLQRADLSGADLSGADLRGVALDGAIVAGAKFKNADLRGVDMSGAQGVPADLTGARTSRATKVPRGWHVYPGADVAPAPSLGPVDECTAKRAPDEKAALFPLLTGLAREK